MPRLRNEDIENIRQKADIADIIGRYIPIERKGNNYRAICPFHDDHSPSMNISVSKQIYKCFVCNAGGNVFKFVGEFEKIGYVESVIKVAELINYPLEIEADVNQNTDDGKNRLYKCMNDMISYTSFALKSDEASRYLEYLHKRGINDELIEKFGIGFNGNNTVYRFLKAKGYSDKEMNELNLIRISQSGIYDVFSNRITFPIHDANGNPIGFTARTLDPDQSKYINTSETKLYVKGNILYNFHRARQSAKKENRVILVEGVMDVIAYGKAGISNVVASLGTALTSYQLNLLKQCSMNIILSYDGDNAGQNAIYKAGKLAKENGFNVMVVKNETMLDPDEIQMQMGNKVLAKMAAEPITWMEFLFHYLQKKYNFELYSDKKAYAMELMEEISRCQDDYDRLNYSHQLSNITGFDVQSLLKEKKEQNEPVKHTGSIKVDGLFSAEMNICSQMLKSAEAIEIYITDLGFLPDPELQMVALSIIDDYHKHGNLDPSRMMDHTKDEKIRQFLLELCSNSFYLQEYNRDVLMGAIRKIKITTLENRGKELQSLVRIQIDPQKSKEMMIELSECLRKLRVLYDEKE